MNTVRMSIKRKHKKVLNRSNTTCTEKYPRRVWGSANPKIGQPIDRRMKASEDT